MVGMSFDLHYGLALRCYQPFPEALFSTSSFIVIDSCFKIPSYSFLGFKTNELFTKVKVLKKLSKSIRVKKSLYLRFTLLLIICFIDVSYWCFAKNLHCNSIHLIYVDFLKELNQHVSHVINKRYLNFYC